MTASQNPYFSAMIEEQDLQQKEQKEQNVDRINDTAV